MSRSSRFRGGALPSQGRKAVLMIRLLAAAESGGALPLRTTPPGAWSSWTAICWRRAWRACCSLQTRFVRQSGSRRYSWPWCTAPSGGLQRPFGLCWGGLEGRRPSNDNSGPIGLIRNAFGTSVLGRAGISPLRRTRRAGRPEHPWHRAHGAFSMFVEYWRPAPTQGVQRPFGLWRGEVRRGAATLSGSDSRSGAT
jgi:hypothetical protein